LNANVTLAYREPCAKVGNMNDAMLDQLSAETCLDLLRIHLVGRIAVVVGQFPIVMPVNYRLVESGESKWIIIRTRSGNEIDQGSLQAAFQIDNVDAAHRTGWSVLVRGYLSHLDADAVSRVREQFDPQPWAPDRNAWLALRPTLITGKRLHTPNLEWAFHVRGYI
jgi:hypothetical protein